MLFMINHVKFSKTEGWEFILNIRLFFIIIIKRILLNTTGVFSWKWKIWKMCMYGTFKFKRRCYMTSVYCVDEILCYYNVTLMCLFFLFLPLRWKTQTQKTNKHSVILHKHYLLHSFFPVLLLTLVPPGPAWCSQLNFNLFRLLNQIFYNRNPKYMFQLIT